MIKIELLLGLVVEGMPFVDRILGLVGYNMLVGNQLGFGLVGRIWEVREAFLRIRTVGHKELGRSRVVRKAR